MQPLINLKQFLAVLALLIIPAALLTAYFRNVQPASGGSAHGHHAMGGESAPMADHHGGGQAPQPAAAGQMDHSKMSNTAGGEQAQTGGGESKQPPAGGQMDHSKISAAAGEKAPPAEPTQAQVEASRMQLDASRAQLEASRKLLEATPDASQPQQPAPAQVPGATPSPAKPAASGATPQPKAADGHAHKH